MRKVTLITINAFLNDSPITVDNTTVDIEDGKTKLYLFGNLIAWKSTGKRDITITNAGWTSNTTKERLNALPNVKINQKNRQWYLNGNLWDGNQTLIKAN